VPDQWWTDAVIYQIYPRSFQDSDGDGIGDLPGIEQRLDHLVDLGVDGLWLSPMYPSPQHDFGYDVADFTGVEPAYGTMEDFDRLVAAAHDRGLRLLLDLVPSHTSIEHPWFREHPDWYVWHEGDEPPNNWRAVFGGRAWTRDEERGAWYLHSFYPEQPDLDWRNPEVVAAMQGVVRFWIDRGVDGFRLDAIDRIGKHPGLLDDPPATTESFFPIETGEYAELDHRHSKNTEEVRERLAALREAAGDTLLVGEIYLPTSDWPRYLESLDRVFAFELFHGRVEWDAGDVRAAVERALEQDGPAWAFSNHDAQRLVSRLGEERARSAAVLLLTLPGMAFMYQGDELGTPDGPGADPPRDRHGRDRSRHPVQWDASPKGGFTTGEPWLPVVDPETRNVEAQREDPESLLSLYRELIALRRRFGGGMRFLDAPDGVLAYDRGRYTVVINFTGEERPVPIEGVVALATEQEALTDGRLAPGAAIVVET
jgi:alpha-glucosidase